MREARSHRAALCADEAALVLRAEVRADRMGRVTSNTSTSRLLPRAELTSLANTRAHVCLRMVHESATLTEFLDGRGQRRTGTNMLRYVIRGAVASAVLTAAIGLASSPAEAQTTAIVLSCTQSAGAVQGTITFQPSLFDSSQTYTVNVSCGSTSISGLKTDRQRVPVPFSAGAITYTFTTLSANGSGGQIGSSALSFRNTPIYDNANLQIASLAVRG